MGWDQTMTILPLPRRIWYVRYGFGRIWLGSKWIFSWSRPKSEFFFPEFIIETCYARLAWSLKHATDRTRYNNNKTKATNRWSRSRRLYPFWRQSLGSDMIVFKRDHIIKSNKVLLILHRPNFSVKRSWEISGILFIFFFEELVGLL